MPTIILPEFPVFSILMEDVNSLSKADSKSLNPEPVVYDLEFLKLARGNDFITAASQMVCMLRSSFNESKIVSSIIIVAAHEMQDRAGFHSA